MAHPLITGAVNPQKLRDAIGEDEFEEIFAAVNAAMYAGNHWLEGRGYVGAPPDPEDRNAPRLWMALRRTFTSKNVVKEVTDRQVAAILGNVPDYGFTVRRARKRVPKMIPDPAFRPPAPPAPDPNADPNAPPDPAPAPKAPMIPDPKGTTVLEDITPDEQALIDEAKAAMEVFYTARKPLKFLKKLLRRRLTQSRAYLRLFVPPKFAVRGEDGSASFPLAKDLNEAVERIFLSEPTLKDCTREVDEESQDEVYIYGYTRADRTQVFEVSFLDDAGKTVIASVESKPTIEVTSSGALRMLPPAPAAVENARAAAASQKPLDGIPEANVSVPLDLNGRLTMFELKGEPLITEQIRTNNFSLNLNLTMSNHVTVESGFRELAVTNVELETERVPDSRAPGGFRDVPKKLKRGGGVINNLVGIAEEDKDGRETLKDPEVFAFEPVAIKTFDDGQKMFRANCLDEAHQTYVLMTGDATASGESRIQALTDFVMFSLDYKEEIDDAGAWLMETVLYWASVLMGKPGRYNGLRANFSSKMYVGKISAAERTALMAEVAARLRSREGYMMAVGDITDPAEELARIDAEESASPDGQRTLMALQADRLALGLDNPGSAGGAGGGK